MMSLQNKFKIFNILVLFRLVSCTCVHIGIVLFHQIQNPTQNLRNSQDYTWEFNLSISASHCCFVLLRLKVLGLLAWGLGISGDGFCCCLLSPSSFFCNLQKGQSRPHPHFSAFRLCGLLFCPGFFLQRRVCVSCISVLLLFSDPIVFLEVPSSYPRRGFQTSCLHWAMGYLLLLVLMMHYSWALVGLLVREGALQQFWGWLD